MGLLIALLVPANSAAGIVNMIYMPMAVLSGFWLPLRMLPHWMQIFAPYLPAYHLGQITLGLFGYQAPGSMLLHWCALLGFTLLMLGICRRRLPPRRAGRLSTKFFSKTGCPRSRFRDLGFPRRSSTQTPDEFISTPSPTRNNYTLGDLTMPTPNHPKRELDPPLDLYGRSTFDAPRTGANYIWLAYSCFFFIEPFFRKSPTYWAQQLPIFALFLALYIAYVQICRGRARILILFAFFLLGVGDIPFNFGASSFFIYVAAMLPFSLDSPLIFAAVMALEAITLALENHWTHNNPVNYAVTGFFAIVVGVSNLFIAQGKRADLKLRDAQEENLSLAAVAERERIARDLHDVLGHTLVRHRAQSRACRPPSS